MALLGTWTLVGYLFWGQVGAGGWRHGLAGTIAWFGVGLFAITARGLRGVSERWGWATAAGILGVVLAVVVANRTAESVPRLAAHIDAVVAGRQWRQTRERRAGHGWCSPQCPELVRSYVVPDPASAYSTAELALHRLGLGNPRPSIALADQGASFRGSGPRFDGSITIAPTPERIVVTIGLRSRRP
ncbi:MAG: hypothetical protein NVS3B12_00800 [Acidimicrobiales bacterium]